jgi:2-oxoglutarate dehydrogenase E2 component (dihydrolipoamide succinyltransferase)
MNVVVGLETLGEEKDADLMSWLVEDGSVVEAGQAIAVLETAKVTLDIEAPVAGVIRILVRAGQVVELGQAIARVEW